MIAARMDQDARERVTAGLTPPPGELDLVALTRLASWNAPLLSGPSPTGLRCPGERLAGTPYVVVRLLGQGGMGEVYEVEHAPLGRRAALKLLHRNHQDRPDLAARLREEARLLGRLRHPNLVEVFDLGVTAGGRPYFAMPLLHGRDLREELTRARALPPDAAMALAVQALDGLAAAHAAGLVHRDVKLENLFLEEDGTLKVLDFGIAKVMREGDAGHTDPGASPGTPRSMAPEQCAGERVDARADLYAVGLVLYELCTGRGPFDELRGNHHALRFAHCDRRPDPPSRRSPHALGPAVDALVLRALAKAPEDRFQTAEEMAAALRRLLAASRQVAAGVPEPPPRSARRWKRRRARDPWNPVAAACAAASFAVAFFALGLAFGRTMPVVGAAERAAAVATPVTMPAR